MNTGHRLIVVCGILFSIFSTSQPLFADEALDCQPYQYLKAEPFSNSPNVDSFLLKLTLPAKPPSYVLATVHVGGAALLSEWEILLVLLQADGIDTVVTERDMLREAVDRDAVLDASKTWMIPGLEQALINQLNISGMRPSALAYAPWYLSTVLMPVPKMHSVSIDEWLQGTLNLTIKSVYLETFNTIAFAYSALSDLQQQRLLAETLCNQDRLRWSIEAQADAYARNDVQVFFNILSHWQGQDAALVEQLNVQLVQRRNKHFIDQIQPKLERGGVFVAMGAQHVFGDTGLLQALERAYPDATLESVELESLLFDRGVDTFPVLLDWIAKALKLNQSVVQQLKTVMIEAVSTQQLKRRLCPSRRCRVDSTVKDHSVLMTYPVYAQLLAGDDFAKSLLLRELARIGLSLVAECVEQSGACQRSQVLRKASQLQQQWALEQGLSRPIQIFP